MVLNKFAILLLSLLFFACEKTTIPEMEEEMEEEEQMPVANVLQANGGCPDTLAPFYIEKDGYLMIEMESAEYAATDWKIDSTINGASNRKYLVWRGPNNFNLPGRGILTFKVRIENPGTYRFIWRSRITQGTSNTDFNDSWLRIRDAKHFYAQKGNGDIVYPKGTMQEPISASSGQQNTTPEGAGSGGWFKVYMNNVNEWKWRSTTSDNDPHQIFTVFDQPGDYTVEISGRSTGHGIDKFTLFSTDISENVATSSDRLSDALCE